MMCFSPVIPEAIMNVFKAEGRTSLLAMLRRKNICFTNQRYGVS